MHVYEPGGPSQPTFSRCLRPLLLSNHLPVPTMAPWQDIVAEKKQRQLDAIPKKWIIPADSLPPSSELDVSSYVASHSLLTDLDKEITNSTVEDLLPKLSQGVWSSVDVTTAFYKRAIIAHQVVRLTARTVYVQILTESA